MTFCQANKLRKMIFKARNNGGFKIKKDRFENINQNDKMKIREKVRMTLKRDYKFTSLGIYTIE